MDVSQIASLATSLNSLDTSNQVNNILLKKSLDTQQTAVASMIDSIPQLPANPAIGRNINTTA
ncbi:YjfB family protein [Rahnella sp. C60]|uniref:YjfB family protein n=1 Tax=Rahnella perminowiae TaxID=2816244 RepID=A0ABS6L175_9GAMM|nr:MULTISPECIES: YjfB family protein [Rahnella]UJD89013.1 putative motility protein [Rahnella aquatilis]MBU9811660.1 YjfB family protein [Rahnella perminowiae]MBU9814203.1 YjfB family protein [Rahnella perminowiae]MBU9826452.1 YjfB family protein [Rahnella perminowiae]MBU9835596.1 YjfB family protein [Rahnella perminowiae]